LVKKELLSRLPPRRGARRTINIRRSDGELVMLDNIEGATLLDPASSRRGWFTKPCRSMPSSGVSIC
jgi:hypothetical protein